MDLTKPVPIAAIVAVVLFFLIVVGLGIIFVKKAGGRVDNTKRSA